MTVDAITLAISPCPNDTFVFDAWVNGRLTGAPAVDCRLEDIDRLNRLALEDGIDVVKVSFYTCAMVRDRYELLNAGGALGRGCGPLVVTRPGMNSFDAAEAEGITVAVPGRWTTANLLFSLWRPELKRKVVMRFDEIMPAVSRGEVDAGVIIHEGRFTFQQYGLAVQEDLGAWWERTTGHPIPLGGIIARKSLGREVIRQVESVICRSCRAAFDNPLTPRPFMRAHAREMDDSVMQQHVDLYVNRHSLDYGEDGRRAIDFLVQRA
ncbi:MAG: 1,4-dihydroxy-6-naphthoate synthase, partial [Deltaproteobacteria bacterium]|nr:1,4-dihydroxy-6-naphthoate synthase [Deltaproteobacteria bacterium]